MNKTLQKILLFGSLILLSACLYFIHFLLFSDIHHILYYLVSDIAFLPLEILFVSLIFHRLLEENEKKNTMKKLNMVIGVFFSEIGNELLLLLFQSDRNLKRIKDSLLFQMEWRKKEFKVALAAAESHEPDMGVNDLNHLKSILVGKREFMINIMEYPVLLEHELFSEVMMAIFHLEEELSLRTQVEGMPPEDLEHIQADILRVYRLLMKKWISYIRHLSEEYPYLYSFAVRTNPLQKKTAGTL